MAHQQHGALVFGQQFLQQVQRFHVQVVGGFVQHQQVGGPGEQLGQQQAVALAAGQYLGGQAQPVRLEQEVAQVPGHVAAVAVDLYGVRALGHVVHDRFLAVQGRAQLVEIGDLQPGAVAHLAGMGGKLPQQQAQQGGLAGTVGADQPHPVAALDQRRKVAQHRLGVLVGKAHVARLDDQLARAFRLLRQHGHPALPFTAAGAFLAQGVQGAHPAHVARAPGLDALAHPGFFLGQLLVEQGELALLVLQPGLALLLVLVVPAGIGMQPAPVHLHDAGGQTAHEGPVVRDEHQRARAAHQIVFQPGDGVDVDVVGGFVQQQILRGHQGAGQQHAALAPAGQGGELALRVQAQVVAHGQHIAVMLPPFARFQPAPRRRQGGLVHGAARLARGFQHVEGRQRLALCPKPPGHDAEHRAGHVHRHLLRHAAKAHARRAHHLARIGAQLTGHQAQQRRLARPVAPHKADALTLLHVQGGPVQQLAGAEVERDVLNAQQCHASIPPKIYVSVKTPNKKSRFRTNVRKESASNRI
ncbi:hypothetical protein DSECCO2_645370 [anaerobic digester metagenome]